MEGAATGPVEIKNDHALADLDSSAAAPAPNDSTTKPRPRRRKTDVEDDPSKRRCVSTACIACRKRKSKCDGNTPACAACSQVYGTPCIYDPNSDHRRKGVYKHDFDNSKSRNTTLHTLIEAILNYPEDEAFELVRELRQCDSLDVVAERIGKGNPFDSDGEEDWNEVTENGPSQEPSFERHLYGRMGDLRLDDGTVRYIGGTSHLIHIDNEDDGSEADEYHQQENAVASWTTVTNDAALIDHLLTMYYTWHYPFFVIVSRTLFYRDFLLGKPPPDAKRKTHYCTSLLVNAMLALGCHFTAHPGARENPDDSATAGDHFFREAKRLIMENDEHERPRLTNIQALALMSLREAGCARESKGWVYSGMSFRLLYDMGLNLNTGQLAKNPNNEVEEDVRRITFWGCYLFDKCWSNYLGRMPQISSSMITVPKFEVFPDEDSALWSPYSDSGMSQAQSQPARTRAVALQISTLARISDDLFSYFYNPADIQKARGKSAELKMLSDIHTRLESWRRQLPKEFEPSEGGLSSILLMHMFFQLLFIHLFRPFLKYTPATTPLPQSVSPRKLCTQAAAMISKLMRLYKRSYGLRQIANISVYIAHSANTIHLLNLPDRNAKRDITHGLKHLEEIAEGWLCARRSLVILSGLARKWNVELPEEAIATLARTDRKFGKYRSESQSPVDKSRQVERVMTPSHFTDQQQQWQNNAVQPAPAHFVHTAPVPTPDLGLHHHRSNSASHPSLPHDATGLANQQYGSAPTTTQHAVPHQTNPEHSRNIPSPTEMFGGVEQLLRDGQDWTFRDQSQIVPGFGTWASINMDPSTWANAVPDENMAASRMSGMPNSMTTSNVQASTANMYAGNMNNGGFPVMDWLNNQMGTYDEAEWYQ